jgi:hypothetical protein
MGHGLLRPFCLDWVLNGFEDYVVEEEAAVFSSWERLG